MKNGFFQLLHKVDGTYIKLVPPADGGEALSISELMEYLNIRGIPFDMNHLNKELIWLDSEKIVLLNDKSIFPCRESFSLRISDDKMQAVARFYAPSMGAEEMTPAELLSDLRAKGIRYGLLSDNIMEYFSNRTWCTDIVVAQGKPFKLGKDSKIEYLFPTDRKAKPALLEDGSVDFHTLNTICACKEGDVLARLTPAVQGINGSNVCGEQLKTPAVKQEKLQFGKNIELSGDKLEIRSKINGHVMLVGGEVFVSDLLELENVDVSTGNIEYDGAVKVNGNVFSGYSIKATGDIEIKGVVEGARVESGGNISIARGMNGMSKGILIAKGHIVSKFLENAEVSAGNYIATESILHCNVQAGTEINVTGKRGFITGGKVMASNKISVKTLGSHMGASTIVEVGTNPELKKRQIALLKNMQEVKKFLNDIEPILVAAIQKKKNNIAMSAEQLKNVQNLMKMRVEKKKELSMIEMELDELDEILTESKNPSVEVEEEVYPGTKICILDVSQVIKSVVKYCRFIRSEGDVKMTALH